VANATYWGAGALTDTTIGAMELTAVNEALRALLTLPAAAARPCRIVSDSQYVVQAANAWVTAWEKRGWKTKSGPVVKNRALWEQYLALARDVKAHGWAVTCHWVKGHNGHAYNTLADQRAGEAVRQLQRGEKVAPGPGFANENGTPLFSWPIHTTHPIDGAPVITIHFHPELHTWTADWLTPTSNEPSPSPLTTRTPAPTPDAVYLAVLRLLRNQQGGLPFDAVNVHVPSGAAAFFLPSASRSDSLTPSARSLARELLTEIERHKITSWHLSRRSPTEPAARR